MTPEAAPWASVPPPLSELHEAARRLRGVAVETPLLESERLNARLGGRVLVKAEGLQHTGSFKLRGAWNYLSQPRPGEESGRGLLALSSGNHGLAVAWAARRLGLGPVVVLMPFDTPATKVERTRDWGAEVVFFDRATVDRAALIEHWIGQGYRFIPAYDDRRIIAGTGTIALEAMAQAATLNATPELMIAACSGAGLSAGCAIALGGGGTRLLAVEPPDYDDLLRSLEAGERVHNAASRPSICDALLAVTPGALPFAIHQQTGTRAAVVEERHARKAVFTLLAEFGLVVEPSGALPLGALLADPALAQGKTVVVLASGRNLDAKLCAEILAENT